MRTFELDTVVARLDRTVAAQVDGEVMVLDVERAKYYSMEGLAGLAWKYIDGSRTVAAICEALRKELGVGLKECVPAVIAFLNELAAQRLIEAKNNPLQ